MTSNYFYEDGESHFSSIMTDTFYYLKVIILFSLSVISNLGVEISLGTATSYNKSIRFNLSPLRDANNWTSNLFFLPKQVSQHWAGLFLLSPWLYDCVKIREQSLEMIFCRGRLKIVIPSVKYPSNDQRIWLILHMLRWH